MKKFRTGYLSGVFDMFNISHLALLQKAKAECDYLIIGVLSTNKNNDKEPIISLEDRLKIVEAIKYVDRAVLVDSSIGYAFEEDLKIDVIFTVNEESNKYLSIDNSLSKQLSQVPVIEISIEEMEDSNKWYGLLQMEPSILHHNDTRIGYTTGVYDMFHIGHLNLLRRAKEKCDFLIVGVSTDECVWGYKHKKPICSFEERAHIVSAIRYVDEVVPQNDMNKVKFLQKHHFDVMFHGDEWKGTDLYNSYEEEFAKYGATIEYLSHTEGISSSILRKKITDK